MRLRSTLGCATAALFAIFLSSAHAAPAPKTGGSGMVRLLKILHDRGSISDEEYEELLRMAEEEAAAAPATVPTAAPVAAPVATPATAQAPAGAPGTQAAAAPKKPAWNERLSIRGYTQLRAHGVFDQDGAKLDVPADRSVSDTDTFLIRRGRFILSGDAHDHVALYAQADFNAIPSSGDANVQMRDLYADISVDADKEFRFRVGQSKVPFGWVNLQSSQNRLALERPDALNSAVEGERDVGVFFYWASKEARKRFRDLVATGLKGSGDYGVLGFGAYSGQGLNRRDLNGEPHWIARASYPFQLASGQYFELGAQAYTGRFVARTENITGVGTPTQNPDGPRDQRVGATFVWYPQPFGVEAEWNFGRGPEISPDFTRIDSRPLHGGYIQFSWRFQDLAWKDHPLGEATPFTRWNYYDGGRKFGRNAGRDEVNELDFGVEWQPLPALELALIYTQTFERTNTSTVPTADTDNAHRVGAQVQFNY